MNAEQQRKRTERKALVDYSKKRINLKAYGALLSGTGRYYMDREVRISRLSRFGGRIHEYSFPIMERKSAPQSN